MTTRPPHGNARMTILALAVLLLGAWNLSGLLVSDSTPDLLPPPGPLLEPELVDVPAARSAVGTGGSLGASRPATGSMSGQADEPVVSPVQAEPLMPTASDRKGTTMAATPSFSRSLDAVFGPDRFVRDPVDDHRRQMEAEPSTIDAGRTGIGPIVDEVVTGGNQVDEPVESATRSNRRPPHKPKTENAYFDAYVAQGKKDVQELVRQAAAILRTGRDPQKMAMLRALFATNNTLGLDYFERAITTLPDVPSREGASVPTAAMVFLCKRLDNPAIKAAVERLAWTSMPNVSADLRRLAAEALLQTATDSDLRRYASYPGYQGVAKTAVAEGERP